MVRDRDEQFGAAQDSLQNLSFKESSGAAKSCFPGFNSKRYTFCFRNMLQMEKHKTYVINTCQKYIEKHLLEQWFVIAKSRTAFWRKAQRLLKSIGILILPDVQIRAEQGFLPKRYLFCFKTMLQMHKTSPQRDLPSKKYSKKHWLEQWFVIAKSRSTFPGNPYKTIWILLVLDAQIRVFPDLAQNVTLFALKQCSKRKNSAPGRTSTKKLPEKH